MVIMTLSQKFENKFTQFENAMKKFAYTDFYLIWVSLVVFVGWVTKCAPIGFCGLILTACIMLVTLDDLLPLVPCIFNAVLMIYTNKIEELLFMWPIFIPLVLAIGIFVVRNMRAKFAMSRLALSQAHALDGSNIKLSRKDKIAYTFRHYNFSQGMGKMFYVQLAVSIVLLFGGIGVISAERFMGGFPIAIALGFGVLGVYLLLNLFLKRDHNRDVGLFFGKMMTYIGIVLCLELIITIVRSGMPISDWPNSYWDLGWGIRNNVATYLSLTMPMTFYLVTRYRHGWIPFLIGVFQGVCIVLTMSRGGMIGGVITGVFSLIFIVIKSKNKKRTLIPIAILCVAVIIVLVIFRDYVVQVIGAIADRGFGSNGRDALYLEAIELFKKYPFQGAGMGYLGNNFDLSVMSFYWFHSTFFQIIGSMGIVGLIVYAIYYFQRFKVLFSNIKCSFNLFILAMWLGFEAYGMIDTTTFVPFPNMMLIILTCLLLESPSSRKEGYVDEYNCNLYSQRTKAFANRISKDVDEYVRAI